MRARIGRSLLTLAMALAPLGLLGADCEEGDGGLLGASEFVVTPEDGELVEAGGYYRVSWVGLQGLANVGIELSTDGGFSWQVVQGETQNFGYYFWNVPTVIAESSILRVVPRNGPGEIIESDWFAIGVANMWPTVDRGIGEVGNAGVVWGNFSDWPGTEFVIAGAGAAGSYASIIGPNPFGEPPLVYQATVADAAGRNGLAIGDIDGDGDLDLVVAGADAAGVPTIRFLRNDGGGSFYYRQQPIQLYGVAVALGDYDNDGDLDLAASGATDPTEQTAVVKVYAFNRSTGLFVDTGVVPMQGLIRGAVAWADLDNDGALDLIVSGLRPGATPVPQTQFGLYASGFSAVLQLPDLCRSAIACGDFDQDGWGDVALTGASDVDGYYRQAWVCRNQHDGTFSWMAVTGSATVWEGSLSWGDADGDGDLDLAVGGLTGGDWPVVYIARNDGFAFADAGIGFLGLGQCGLAWGDIDGDGRLDLATAGTTRLSGPATVIYRNTLAVVNQPPSPPNSATLRETAIGQFSAVLEWDPGSDSETSALTYNVRIWRTADDTPVNSINSDPITGERWIAAPGNAGLRLKFEAKGLEAWMNYSWSVQSVDNSFAGSSWSATRSFSTLP